MKFKFSYLIYFSIIVSVMSCSFCSGNNEEIPIEPISNSTISFDTDVLPIFNTHCNGSYCHGGGADGKYFDSHANVNLTVSNASLLGAINHSLGFEPMPKSQSKLRQGEIDTITTWINEGRLNN